MKNKLKVFATRSAVAMTAAISSVTVFAQTPPSTPSLSGLTDAINFTEVMTGVVAIGVAVAGVYVLIRGVKIILPLIRG